MPEPYYITTPIYYVNDYPHIGHCFTTCVADVAARMARLIGGPDREVFFLTGTDEHAEKVVQSAQAHGVTPMQWADRNAAAFKEAFEAMGFSNDDFVRTTEARHTTRASAYIKQLMDSGDIELGDYEGWFDASQEEYLTETTAKEHDYKSPVTGKPLEKRTEQNYFFRLDRYEPRLKALIENDTVRVLPEARKNEVLGRIRQGLQKVPVSRRIKEGDADWGIKMPGDDEHRIYVWIEALCNYLSVVDVDRNEDERDLRKFWPATVHVMAKDILWFHAVIWPAMLLALGQDETFRSRFNAKTPEDLLPKCVYAHAYFIAEGKKMSKSLGNFIDIDTLRAYSERYSLDALRWYLVTQGPLGATDADFAYQRFVDIYRADLVDGIGNSTSRVSAMIGKYFGGSLVPPPVSLKALVPDLPYFLDDFCEVASGEYTKCFEHCEYDRAMRTAAGITVIVDKLISTLQPFMLIKDPSKAGLVNAILYESAETLRIASLWMYPACPVKMTQLWRDWNCDHLNDPNDPDSGFKAPLAELARWGGDFSLKPGQTISKGDPLFMRADANDPPPGAAAADVG